jgi:hypothetical protein
MKVRGFYGSTVEIGEWDITKTKEFGYHFAVDDPTSSKHRIERTGGHLYEVALTYSTPVVMGDAHYWDLEAILRNLGRSDEYKELKGEASSRARKNFSPLRVEENLIAVEVLDSAGYDAIEYENEGEAGGPAVILWHPEQIRVVGSTSLSELRRFIRMTLES